jgi:S-formylglutathione hydrolase FrmB
MASIEIKSTTKCFNGHLIRFSHLSKITHTTMTVSVYIPEHDPTTHTTATTKYPSLLYLSGLTCTDENVCQKGGNIFQVLSTLKMAFIAPDTSPRGIST